MSSPPGGPCPSTPSPARLRPPGTAALVAATEAMLEPDIGYRLAHHEDLTWRPSTVVTDVTEGAASTSDGAGDGRPHRHAPVHPTVGPSTRGTVGGHRRGHRAVPGLDALCAGADVWSTRSSGATRSSCGPSPPDRRARLPLVGARCGPDSGPKRVAHPRADPPGARPAPGAERSLDQAPGISTGGGAGRRPGPVGRQS